MVCMCKVHIHNYNIIKLHHIEIYLATEDGPVLIAQTLSGDFLPEAKILQSETNYNRNL